jgi:hypothetical protein
MKKITNCNLKMGLILLQKIKLRNSNFFSSLFVDIYGLMLIYYDEIHINTIKRMYLLVMEI